VLSPFRRLTDWMLELAASRRAPHALAAVSFAESSFFPIPPDLMLAPMVLAKPSRGFFYAGLCTLFSVLGGLLGYAIGAMAFGTIGQWLISLYGGADKIENLLTLYREWGALLILVKGLTPIPYKFVTIASGIAGYDLVWFVVLSIITRGARFYLLALVLTHYGEPIRRIINTHGALLTFLCLTALIGGFVALKYLF
jgi:membrane protein YqaA with SNARE-associated domain